ncbi:MAG: glycosyltransferase family protein [Planctomycetota bacterium]|jgi:glycosyltransferase A (GT-A) superfamily protein (DUF2064 family)
MTKSKTARTTAIVLPGKPFRPEKQANQLCQAINDDLFELLGAVKLRMPTDAAPENAAVLADAILTSDGNVLITWADTAAMPIHAVSGALDALKTTNAVVGPCVSGELYLLGLTGPIEPDIASEVSEILFDDQPLEAVTDLLDHLDVETAVLPPWFRVKNEEQLSFAESLARLSLLSEDGEDDFIADRLRLWFEENATE